MGAVAALDTLLAALCQVNQVCPHIDAVWQKQ